MIITKTELDLLADKYETVEFIKNDPIQFPHKGLSNKDKELFGFIASLFAYGNRKLFIKFLENLFSVMDYKPYEFIANPNYQKLKGMYYRFQNENDITELIKVLNKLYTTSNGIKELFEYHYSNEKSIPIMLKRVTDYFRINTSTDAGRGYYQLFPNPQKNGAMKRLNMFLRWMIRKPPVDLGIWDFIPQSELLIPLDVHVARLSREMGLLKTKNNDMKSVIELTENLKTYSPDDPVKYDFAIFGLGINN